MTSPMRAAIVGTGMIATSHLRAARAAGAQVVGVLASTPERGTETAAQWSLPRGYADLDKLLADAPDMVHICTPNATHTPYALALVEAGISVVLEKPVATTLEEAETLVAAAERTGVLITVPYVYRFHPVVREIRARRRAGEFGEIGLVHGSYLQDWMLPADASSWRADPAQGGASRAFADIGSHWCDLAEFVSGEELTDVQATTSILYPTRPGGSRPAFSTQREAGPHVPVTTEDSATATFRTARGIVANTVISQVSAGRKNRLWLEIDGTLGSAVFDQEHHEQIRLGTVAGETTLRRGEGEVSAEQARLNRTPAGHSQGWTDAFDQFVADSYSAFRGDVPDGLPMLSDGVRSVRIVDAVLRSASSGAWARI